MNSLDLGFDEPIIGAGEMDATNPSSPSYVSPREIYKAYAIECILGTAEFLFTLYSGRDVHRKDFVPSYAELKKELSKYENKRK